MAGQGEQLAVTVNLKLIGAQGPAGALAGHFLAAMHDALVDIHKSAGGVQCIALIGKNVDAAIQLQRARLHVHHAAGGGPHG